MMQQVILFPITIMKCLGHDLCDLGTFKPGRPRAAGIEVRVKQSKVFFLQVPCFLSPESFILQSQYDSKGQ